jgi:membrane-associated phospholipid phosphatase
MAHRTSEFASKRISALRNKFPRQFAFLQARFSPEGYLGLHLTAGAVVLICATWFFVSLAEDVMEGDPLTVTDIQFSAWLHAHAIPKLTTLMLVITHIHSLTGISVMTFVAALYLLWRRHRYRLLGLLLSVYGGMLLNVLLKNIFHRTRPKFDGQILTLSSYGFPSGHTMASTCFYGALAVFAVWKFKSWGLRLASVGTAGLLILLVGFSRIYLGAHYLSDVLGAMGEGLAWLALCITGINTIWRRRHHKRILSSSDQSSV